jgi:hypothetical protein
MRLSGPLGIARLASQAAQVSFIEVLWLAALLSISLGLINLFPIPIPIPNSLLRRFSWKPLLLRIFHKKI